MPIESKYTHKEQEWKRLYESGLSFTQIGKLEGIHYSTVRRILKGVVTPRPKQTFADKAERWVNLYVNEEYSVNEIADIDKTSVATVSKYLKLAGVTLRRQYGQHSPFEKDIPNWVNLYNNGKSLIQIAEQYNTFPQTVHKHIHKLTGMREYTETSRTYVIENLTYFESIDSPEKAYWLGIWYGTGFVSGQADSHESTLVIAKKEEETLHRFKKVIGTDIPLLYIDEEMNDSVKLRINSKAFHSSLTAHGMLKNKTKAMTFPDWLPTHLIRHFVRGYYEGKGTCHIHTHVIKGRTYKQISFAIYGNEAFLQTLSGILKDQLNVELSVTLQNPESSKAPIYFIKTSKRETIFELANWFYQDVTEYSPMRDVRLVLKQL